MANASDSFMKETERVIALATQEAQRLHHNFVGTEHLLLALAADEDTTAAELLSESGVRLDRLQGAVRFINGAGQSVKGNKIQLTPHAKRAVELAQLEAYVLNSNHCGSEHLLLGILHEGEGLGAGLLESSGFARARLYAKFSSILRSKCPRCGAKVTGTVTDYPLVLKRRIVITRNVPAEVCSQCGELVEIQFISELQERVRHLVESDSLPCAMAELPVYDFGGVP